MNVKFTCENCKEEVQLEVEVESPSDYYLLDENCPECNKKFPESVNDVVYNAISNYYAGIADLCVIQ